MRAWFLRSAVLLITLVVGCGSPAGEHPFMNGGGAASGTSGGAGTSGGSGTSGQGNGGSSGTPGVGGSSTGGLPGTGAAPATGGGAGSGGGGAGVGGGVSGSGGAGTGGSGAAGSTGFCNPPVNDPLFAQTHYAAWKTRFVTSSGAGGNLRVQRPEDGNDTVSEGIAYGMLFAVYLDDRATFDGLWAYAKAHMSNGLMGWHINSGGSTIDGNAASDADEDMAWALFMAAKKWGGSYQGEAVTLTNALYQQEVSGGQLKPAPTGLDGNRNPSYLAPAYYRLFAQETGQAGWMAVVDWSYSYLNQTANGSTGLVPDWTGSPRSGPDYRYDACRTPWRIAQDYCWNGEMRARDYATKVTTFFAGIGVGNIVDGYQLGGNPIGTAQNSMSFLGPVGVGAMAAGRSAVAEDVLGRMNTLLANTSDPAYSYYNASWGLLSMLMLTNSFRPL